jgi:NADH:ubiquinone oxidoreductase subunit 5 (subunit L)/multisubunit Na+/H+ antiporter MnhA subunit
MGSLSAFFTSFYSVRLIFLTFFNSNNNSKSTINLVHESSLIMLIPLLLLCLGSIFVGFLAKDLFIGLGVDT